MVSCDPNSKTGKFGLFYRKLIIFSLFSLQKNVHIDTKDKPSRDNKNEMSQDTISLYYCNLHSRDISLGFIPPCSMNEANRCHKLKNFKECKYYYKHGFYILSNNGIITNKQRTWYG